MYKNLQNVCTSYKLACRPKRGPLAHANSVIPATFTGPGTPIPIRTASSHFLQNPIWSHTLLGTESPVVSSTWAPRVMM